MGSHLVPKKVVDKNGRVTTVWVRGEVEQVSPSDLTSHVPVPSSQETTPADHREWFVGLDSQVQQDARNYFVRNYQGQMLDRMSLNDLVSTPDSDLRDRFSQIESVDYTTADDEPEIVFGYSYEEVSDWTDDDQDLYTERTEWLNAQLRGEALSGMMKMISEYRATGFRDRPATNLHDLYRDRLLYTASMLNETSGGGGYDLQLTWSMGPSHDWDVR